MMKAVIVREFSEDLGRLHASDIGRPQVREDEILVKVVAAGVNFVDILYAQGKHQNNKKHMQPPFALGLEFSGIVVSAPPSSPYGAGDALFGDASGSFSEYLAIPANSRSIHPMPPSWSFVEAAGLGATLPVSYAALVHRGALKAGETVLVHSAAGGLGSMATQVAVSLGCKVIGTAGSAAKCAHAREFGASECFNYSEDNWWQCVLDATDGRGVDVVFDPVGLVDMSLKCVAHRGRVLVVGFAGLDGQMEKIAMNRVLLKQVTLIGYRYGESDRRYPHEKEHIWRELRSLLESGKIKAPISKCYPSLNAVSEALQDLLHRKISGKAVIQVSLAENDRVKSML